VVVTLREEVAMLRAALVTERARADEAYALLELLTERCHAACDLVKRLSSQLAACSCSDEVRRD
jgi:hypothetical protein